MDSGESAIKSVNLVGYQKEFENMAEIEQNSPELEKMIMSENSFEYPQADSMSPYTEKSIRPLFSLRRGNCCAKLQCL